MSFFVGVVVFALGIAATIALHEFGHMRSALACGMVVRRFYVGFGPTVFKVRRGGIEYGLKAIPLGGFCDIAGMTIHDELGEVPADKAMVNKPAWQRVFVLLGGILMNLLLAFVLIYAVAVSVGLPNRDADFSAVVESTGCVAPAQNEDGSLAPCAGEGPAAAAGMRAGDKVVAVDGQPVESFMQLREKLMEKPGQTVQLEVQRGAETLSLSVPLESVTRRSTSGEVITVGAAGIVGARPSNTMVEYNPLSAVGGAARFYGMMFEGTVKGLVAFPGKIPGVMASVVGAPRDEESPMSVVGASRIGGELAQQSQWPTFVMLLASLNFFLALFNLLPFPPLDGGHIAVVVYEKLRDAWRRMRGLAPAGPADYLKLMPLTYAVTAALLLVGVVTIAADIVNPIRLF
ncbi:M50 family metallopeptidase [Corynebacterium aquilae]|uniref:Zinc metalloprotease Rip1 n=1 Tax=Corynebacterium aquilae DSM 44791 TaxID=1431546 RepID=A0A1L7CGK5_9CORY|nr:site-2 protease family protein [Corynebacterium aquilae]APT84992.1 signaling protein [Corynebacterium aquilae DSM 44791]